MFQLRHMTLAHRTGTTTQPASCWAQHNQGERNWGRRYEAGSSSWLAWDCAVLFCLFLVYFPCFSHPQRWLAGSTSPWNV